MTRKKKKSNEKLTSRKKKKRSAASPPAHINAPPPPRRTAEQLRLAAATLVHAIKEGTDLWKRERREECHALYAKAGVRAAGQMPPGQTQDDLRVALAAAK